MLVMRRRRFVAQFQQLILGQQIHHLCPRSSSGGAVQAPVTQLKPVCNGCSCGSYDSCGSYCGDCPPPPQETRYEREEQRQEQAPAPAPALQNQHGNHTGIVL